MKIRDAILPAALLVTGCKMLPPSSEPVAQASSLANPAMQTNVWTKIEVFKPQGFCYLTMSNFGENLDTLTVFSNPKSHEVHFQKSGENSLVTADTVKKEGLTIDRVGQYTKDESDQLLNIAKQANAFCSVVLSQNQDTSMNRIFQLGPTRVEFITENSNSNYTLRLGRFASHPGSVG